MFWVCLLNQKLQRWFLCDRTQNWLQFTPWWKMTKKNANYSYFLYEAKASIWIIWICIFSLNITMYLILFSSFEETQRKSIVLLWDESTWLMRIIVGVKYGKIEGWELTVCTLYYTLIYPLVKRYTYIFPAVCSVWFLEKIRLC